MRPPPLIAAAGALGLAAATPAAAGIRSDPERVSTRPADAHSPDVAMNGRARAIAAWVQEAGRRGRIVTSARGASGSWSRPAPVCPPGASAIDPRVAVDPAGGIVAVWRQVVRTRVLRGRRQAVYVARARARRPAGPWGPVTTLSDERQKVGPPEVAMDRRGVAVATWHRGTGARAGTPGHVGEVQIAQRRVGQPWSAARTVSRTNGSRQQARLPQVRVGPGGHAAVYWQRDLRRRGSTAEAVARGSAPGRWSEMRRLPFRTSGDLAADVAVGQGGSLLALSGHARGDVAELRWWRGSAGRRGVEVRRLADDSGGAAVFYGRSAGDHRLVERMGMVPSG